MIGSMTVAHRSRERSPLKAAAGDAAACIPEAAGQAVFRFNSVGSAAGLRGAVRSVVSDRLDTCRRTGSKGFGRALMIAAACLLAVICTVQTAAAGSSSKKRPVSFTVSEYAYKKLEQAHEALAAERYDEASELIEQLAHHRGLNSHERALIEQTRGYIASARERYAEAAAAFERCLALEALPDGAQLNTQYNLAQLYLAMERFDDAIRTLEDWFSRAENPAPSAYYLLAAAYMQSGKNDLALEPARKAVEGSKDPKEPWLQLLLALYLERKDYPRARGLLEQLAVRFPKKTYWLQLSAVYAELGREKDALAAMQVAYQRKLLDKDSELRNLARMYLYHEIPYRAAKVLEEGLDDGIVEPDAKAWELLADAWLSAREYDKAVGPLERAAKFSDDGKFYLRLGRLHMERQEWSEAVASIESALAKKTLDERGKAWVLLGIARLSAGDREGARKALEKARGFDDASDEADRWLAHLDRLERQGRAAADGS